jgi:hypothetical protein
MLHPVAVLQYNAIMEWEGNGVMKWTHVVWDPTAGGNVEHVEEHDLTTDDVTMSNRKLQHVTRQLSDAERARHAQIREAVMHDIPPKPEATRKASPLGIPARVRKAREAQGLTWYALAKLSGIPNQATIRDIEQGKDVKLSNLQAVAGALGLKLELIEEAV